MGNEVSVLLLFIQVFITGIILGTYLGHRRAHAVINKLLKEKFPEILNKKEARKDV